MAYLWNPEADQRSRAAERKAERQQRKAMGIRTMPASKIIDAQTGAVSYRPEHTGRVIDASHKGGKNFHGRN